VKAGFRAVSITGLVRVATLPVRDPKYCKLIKHVHYHNQAYQHNVNKMISTEAYQNQKLTIKAYHK
jgi:hypothetical protein